VSALNDSVLSAERRNAVLKEIPLYPQYEDDPVSAHEELAKNLTVRMVTEKILDPQSGRERDINTGFTVNFDHRDPQLAKRAAEWFANAFVTVSRLDASNAVKDQSKFLSVEAERTRSHISQLEVQLADFKRKNFDQLPESAQTNLNFRAQSDQELNGVERDVRSLQQQKIFLMQQLQQARAANPDAQMLYDLQEQYRRKQSSYDDNHPDMVALRRQIESLKRGTASAGAPSLKEQLATQKAILADTRQRYSDEHPDVKKLKRDIASLEARVASGGNGPSVGDTANETMVSMQLQTQIHATDTQLAALQTRANELHKKLSELDSRLASTPQVERDYEGLTRDLGTARQQYDQLLTKRMEADVQSASLLAGTADRFRMVQLPLTPDVPAKPKRFAILLVGVVGGFMVGLIAALIAEMMDATVRGTGDVRKLLQVTPLAVIPDMQTKHDHWWSWGRGTAAALALALPLAAVLIHMVWG
jgi:uncharacterized protein involved in exopolysaccharide biosynthesis